MDEEIDFIIESAGEAMHQALVHLEKELVNIRAGKASPAMLGSVFVDYYGNPTPLNQVANVNTPDARTISIQPFEKSSLPAIVKGIMEANLGFNPMNNGDTVIISVPVLTEERRKELAKQAKAEAEDSKIAVRNDRKNANQEIKKLDVSDDLKKDA
ncbi:MAG TPA: ribosome recycling factor, partial [Salinimicrobium sp.]|nr:ribosome recycling factor [Salinimicrobium sp.]